MGDIGAEVGLKMRSAIKAKLMELECYVDDELPDYIMVMVANKRTKSQMKEDLTLFLNVQTNSFVDWLHIVLKKLKEVHVTNPDILKRSSKRKSDGSTETTKKIKKEKNRSKSKKNGKKSSDSAEAEPSEVKSLTDDLPITANKLTEVRKIVVMQNNPTNKSDVINEDTFDIPLLSEVDKLSNEEELKIIEKRINSVKNRLGIQIQSNSESDDENGNKSDVNDDFINLKADPEDVISGDVSTSSLINISSHRKATIIEQSSPSINPNNIQDGSHTPPPPHKPSTVNDNNETNQKAATHLRIIYEDLPSKKRSSVREMALHGDDLPRKRSILDRLGKRSLTIDDNDSRSSKIHRSNDRDKDDDASRRRHKDKEDKGGEDRRRETNKKGARSLNLLDGETQKEDTTHKSGIKSKVSVPDQPPKPQVIVEEESDSELEKKVKKKGVPSTIKVKPRVLPPAAKLANKSLLLKAVAEAQRSIAQTPAVGITKRDAIFTKSYKDKVFDQAKARKISTKEKSVLRNMLKAMVNSPLRKVTLEEDDLKYVPKPIKEQHNSLNIQYKPSPRKQLSANSETSEQSDVDTPVPTLDINFKQKFIVTLDGIDGEQFNQSKVATGEVEQPKRISPIIFGKIENRNGPTIKDRSKIPDKLPLVTIPGLKNRERCKFWPNCKSGDNCEFHHPVAATSISDGLCKMFPNCKFGDKCLYLHPICKFENSCTRRDCPYSHKLAVSRIVSTPSICKYHPKCSNIHCSFYHPLTKPCKFGKYCKNQPECMFSHSSTAIVPKPASLTWRSKS